MKNLTRLKCLSSLILALAAALSLTACSADTASGVFPELSQIVGEIIQTAEESSPVTREFFQTRSRRSSPQSLSALTFRRPPARGRLASRRPMRSPYSLTRRRKAPSPRTAATPPRRTSRCISTPTGSCRRTSSRRSRRGSLAGAGVPWSHTRRACA